MIQYMALLLLVVVLLGICVVIQLANVQRLLKRVLGEADRTPVSVKRKSDAA